MTSLCTIPGLLPPALGLGPGAQMQQPLAITVIGGLITNMLPTRLPIPVGCAVPAGRRAPGPVAPWRGSAERSAAVELGAAFTLDRREVDAMPGRGWLLDRVLALIDGHFLWIRWPWAAGKPCSSRSAAADRGLPMGQCGRGFMRIPPMLGHWFVISMCWVATPALSQEHHKDHSAADLNKQFQDPNLDVQRFVQRFETDSREIFAQRQAIVRAVDLRPGLAVADIGAGTGLFTWMFAEEVGPKGTVYAVEIAPAFLKSIGEQARQRRLETVVKTVRSTQETTNLAPGSIDVAFVCATYHHFEHPEKVLASIHQALRPGGRLVVIDFDLRQDSSAFVRERARAPKGVYFREIEAAGFTQVKAQPSLHLKENFFAVFQRRRGTGLPGHRST